MSWAVIICDWRTVGGDINWKPAMMVPTPTRVVVFANHNEAVGWAYKHSNESTTCVVLGVEQGE